MFRSRALICILIIVLTAVSACGSPGGADPADGSTTASPTVQPVDALVALVPADIRSKGSITVATSSNLPPMTYVAEDNSTLIGFDVDMARAVAGILDLRADVRTAGFDTLIPGLEAGRYTLALSSIGVTEERQKVVDFVSYYNGGQGFLAAGDSDFEVSRLEDLCGLRVAVQSGSTQQSTLEKDAALCPKAGRKPYDLQVFPNNNAAVLALEGNRADVLYASISIVEYTAAQTDSFRVAGRYKRATVGIALPKGSALTAPVQRAVQQLIDDGTYAELLDRWGLRDNAVGKAEINNATPAR